MSAIDSTDTTAQLPDGGLSGIAIDDDVRYITPDEIAEAAGEQAAPELPDFIPDKFRAATLEESAAKLAKSYGELESKLGALSERAKQADLLQAELEQLYAIQQNAAADAYTGVDYEVERQQALVRMQQTEIAARNAATARAFQEVPGLAEHAVEEMVALPRWQTDFQAALTEMSPDWRTYGDQLQHAMQSGRFQVADGTDPRQAAAAASALVGDMRAERERLLAIQTATGAGTRPIQPNEQAAWDAIKGAGKRDYWHGISRD